jgi:hypothetical protein
MSEISGVTVDFEMSPRIATVPISLDAVTVQDWHDTLTNIQGRPENMSFDDLIDSAGKEDLGGGVAVGVTATMQNCKIAFSARLGPSYVQCTVSGGNIVALDGNGDPMSPIEPTAFTQIITAASSSATLLKSAAAALIEKLLRNRLELSDGGVGNWVLYDDDDVTPLLSWDVTDKNGNPIAVPAGVPARRTRGI